MLHRWYQTSLCDKVPGEQIESVLGVHFGAHGIVDLT